MSPFKLYNSTCKYQPTLSQNEPNQDMDPRIKYEHFQNERFQDEQNLDIRNRLYDSPGDYRVSAHVTHQLTNHGTE